MDMAMAQVMQMMSLHQLLKMRQTTPMMKQIASEELVHRHNVKFGKNEEPIAKRIVDLIGWAQFHPGISYISHEYSIFGRKMSQREEVYDELNFALNHYLHVIAAEIDNGGTVDSAIKKMFKHDSQMADLLVAHIEIIHRKALYYGIGNMSAWHTLDKIPYHDFPMPLHGKSYPVSLFDKSSQIDPKEVKRVLKPYYNFVDSQYVHIAVALSCLATRIMLIGKKREQFRTREHVREAAMALFGIKRHRSTNLDGTDTTDGTKHVMETHEPEGVDQTFYTV